MITNTRQRNTVLLIVSAIAGIMYLLPFIRFSFYDQMSKAMDLNDVQLGAIGGIYGLFNVICYLPSGYFAERFDAKKMLIISCLGMCILTVWYSFYPGYDMLLVIHALYGVFSVGTFWCSYIKAVRSLASEEAQGKIFGISEGIRGVAQTIVAFICLAAVSRYAEVSGGFRALLYINAAAFFLLALAVLFFVPSLAPDASGEKRKGPGFFTVIRLALCSGSTWICICVIACGYSLWGTANTYVGTYCTRVLNVPDNISSALSIIRSYVIVFAAGAIGGVVLDKFKTKGAGMMLYYALVGVGAAMIMMTQSALYVCIGVTLLLSLMVNSIKSTYWSIMGDAGIPPESTGMATGVISLIGLSPDFIVPPLVAGFITYGEETLGDISKGFDMMYWWMIGCAAAGVFFSFILKRRREKSNAVSA